MNVQGVLLPVYNVQPSLAATVTEILEVLDQMLGRFQLCILDDGSTDETDELAYELGASYPQIRILRHPVHLGLGEAIQTTLDHVGGDPVLIVDDHYPLAPEDLRMLWQLRDSARHSMADQPAAGREPRTERLLAYGARPLAGGHGWSIQQIRREAFEKFRTEQALELVHRIDLSPAITATTRRPSYLGQARKRAGEP